VTLGDQQIRFCRSSDGVRLAYAAVGSGPPLVKAANWLNHLEFDWNSPVMRPWLVELSRYHTLIRYDERGCGLSDWDVADFSLEAWVHDLETVVDAYGVERFPLLGISQGGPIAITYAHRHPERVSQLILYGSYSRGRRHWVETEQERSELDLMIEMVRVGWGKDHPAFRQVFTTLFVPDGTPEQFRWMNELQRVSTSPENAVRLLTAFHELDAKQAAMHLDVPTLVLHATGDLRVPFREGERLARLIPRARFVPLESRNHLLLGHEPAFPTFIAAIHEFLEVKPTAVPRPDRTRVEAIFDEAMDLPAEERAASLDRACGSNAELRAAVERLIASAEATGGTAMLAGAMAAALGGARRDDGPLPAQIGASYDVIERIGGGGMGVVYRARDRRLMRHVALKVLPDALEGEPLIRERFLQEAKAAASLDHPNICTVYGVDQGANGQLVIVMPCYDGETLRAKIDRGPLPVADALEYTAQIAAGLAHAHGAGIVHRDVKPANVMVTREGQVKILDFGIAKLADARLTRSGMVLGTYAYMSPEQAGGEPVDRRSDLWSLGVVLYEMLAGVTPFRGESGRSVLAAILRAQPAAPSGLRSDVPPEVDAFVLWLLSKEPEDRPENAAEVLTEVQQLRGTSTRSSAFSG
jgi:pimeloyl-ACP methyl ester carboxylesterase/tRNA A-37 threonylcarbamoyl transferase component Bud32